MSAISFGLEVDDYAMAGYRYASGFGPIPQFGEEIDIDAFNAGIRNYNETKSAHVFPVHEAMKRTYHDTDGGHSDKELATVWGQL